MSTNPYWQQATWFIDPQNTSGGASDGNTGLTALTPLVTFAELAARWGTYSPHLRQNTTITFLSSHTDNTDPVYLRPFIENGATIILQGTTPTVLASIVLAGVVAKNRATPQLLNATLGASGAAAVLVQNTTAAKSSRAWAYKVVSGTTFSMTQPLAPLTLPFQSVPAEVDTWANGDTANLLTPIAINVVSLEPTMADDNGAFDNLLYAYQCTIFDPAGVGTDPIFIGDHVSLVECAIQRFVMPRGNNGSEAPLFNAGITNCALRGGTVAGQGFSGAFPVTGGAWYPGAFARLIGGNVEIDGDAILGVNLVVDGANIGFAYVDTSRILLNLGHNLVVGTLNYGGSSLYGPGSVDMTGMSRLSYPSGAGAAVAHLQLTGSLEINGLTTAHSVISGTPDVLNGSIGLTAAHLDAAAGAAGFGGNAFNPGGGAIANTL